MFRPRLILVSNIRQYSKSHGSQKKKTNVQVAILGAETGVGKILAYLLKQNPLVSVLHLLGTNCNIENLGFDLSHFDTQANLRIYDIKTQHRSTQIADIIVLLGVEQKSQSLERKILAEAPRVIRLAEISLKYSPKAMMVVCAEPISVMMPLVGHIYEKSIWYHPARLIGSAALPQIKANTIIGRHLNLNPHEVYVPIIGGPDLDCAVPMFSKTVPIAPDSNDWPNLLANFRRKTESKMAEAFGINRLVTILAAGICEMPNSICSAFMRTNLITHCRNLVTSVFMGRCGIIHNYGINKLAKYELDMFEKAVYILKRRQEMAQEYLSTYKTDQVPKFMEELLKHESLGKEKLLASY